MSSRVPPFLPLGTTDSEQRGRAFFEDQLPDRTMKGACAVCHSGPMLNETNQFARQLLGLPRGLRIASAGVSERNVLKNPVYRFEIRDRVKTTMTTPDIGVLMSDLTSPSLAAELRKFPTGTSLIVFANMFKIPTLWGVKDTAPYFHDNSAKNFDELLEHYNVFFESVGGFRLSEQDMQDIKAFLNLL